MKNGPSEEASSDVVREAVFGKFVRIQCRGKKGKLK